MALPFSLSIKPFHAYTRFQMYRRYERGRCLCQLRLLCPNRKHIERESRLTVYHVKVNPRALIRTPPLFILHGGRRLIITRYQEPYHKTSESLYSPYPFALSRVYSTPVPLVVYPLISRLFS